MDDVALVGNMATRVDAWTSKEVVPLLCTPNEAVGCIIELIEDVGILGASDDQVPYVVDLGCGDGRVVIAAGETALGLLYDQSESVSAVSAKAGLKAVGVDVNKHRLEEAKQKVTNAGVGELVDIIEVTTLRRLHFLSNNVACETIMGCFFVLYSN